MSVSITCYDGVLSIGGNKILLEDEERKTRLFFDFGLPFARRYLFFEEYLRPRAGVGLRDPLRLGLLPPLEGVYRADFVAALSPEDKAFLASSPLHRHFDVDGVLLSHAHLDHSGYISFLHADIPIYTTAMTAFIAKVVQDIGQSADIEREVCYFTWRELEGGLLRPVRQKKNPLYHYQGRPFLLLDQPSLVESGFWFRSPVFTKEIRPQVSKGAVDRIGNLPLRYFPVDHSIFGATAFAVETSAGWVIYTGDFRLHGTYGYLTERFIEEVAALDPVALLCEGTRIDDDERVTEEEVFDAALEAAKGASGLIIADFAARNVERLITFLQVAKEIGRRLAISPADAYLLEAMRLASPDLPDMAQDEHLVVYADVKSAPRPWEERLRNRYRREGRLIGAPDVRDDPGGYILCFSFFDINDLVDIDPQGGTYIYSSSEAYNEESVLDLWRLRNWLRTFEVEFIGDPDRKEEHRELHASGHASGADLLSMIKQIYPQVLIPIHTEKPELFAKSLTGTRIKVCLPERGKPIGLP
jgi:ribonuclease J